MEFLYFGPSAGSSMLYYDDVVNQRLIFFDRSVPETLKLIAEIESKAGATFGSRSEEDEDVFKIEAARKSEEISNNASICRRGTISGKEKLIKCDICDHVAYSKFNLERHKRNHGDDKPFKCHLCDYSSSARSGMIKHAMEHSRDSQERYTCARCAFSTHLKGRFIRHLLFHEKRQREATSSVKGQQRWYNHKAARQIRGREPLHERKKEENPMKPKYLAFTCDVCNATLTSKLSLKKHKLRHEKTRSKRIYSGGNLFKCPLCVRAFPTQSFLDFHKKCHSTYRPYKCNECNYAAKLKQNLARHKRVHAAGNVKEPHYLCPHCEYSTHYRAILTRHIKTHGNEFKNEPKLTDLTDLELNNNN